MSLKNSNDTIGNQTRDLPLSFKIFGHKDGGSNSRLEQTCTMRSFMIFHSSPNIIWVVKIKGDEMGEVQDTLLRRETWAGILVGYQEGRGRRRTWENNIRIRLEQLGLDGMDWMYLAENRDRDE